MSEMVKLTIDLSTKAISIECPEASIDKVFERVEALLSVVHEIRSEDPTSEIDDPPQAEPVSIIPAGSQPPQPPARRQRGKGKAETYTDIDLGLSDAQKRQFTEFYKHKSPRTGEEKILTIMVWLTTEAKKERLNNDEVFSDFRVVAERVNIKITPYMRTLKSTGKLTHDGDGFYKITHHAEDLVEKDLPRVTVNK